MVTQSKLIQCPTIEQLLSNELGNGKKWNCSGLIEGTPLSGFCVEGLWRPQKAQSGLLICGPRFELETHALLHSVTGENKTEYMPFCPDVFY
jgi:hypothetical protein